MLPSSGSVCCLFLEDIRKQAFQAGLSYKLCSVVVLSFYVLVFKFLCCWRLMYVFIFLVKFR